LTGPCLLASADDVTAAAAIRAVTTGAKSVSDLAGASLRRAEVVEGEIHAFRSIDGAAVEHKAKELDDHAGGLLRGLIVGVKDVIDTADAPTGYGSPLFADHLPASDADVVARLRSSGALILGKTESTEFAMFQPTRTRNPVDLERTPGGSSSGSAAAVAAGIVPVALGTQTAGSVIRPAAYCGVYGFKPSKGWTSTVGVWRLAESVDTIGLFARRAADLSIAYRALREASPDQPAQHRPDLRCAAVLRAAEWAETDSQVPEALDAVAGRLADAGWTVVEMKMPPSWRRLPEHHATVMAVEVAANLHDALGDRIELISESARAVVEQGDAMPARNYISALRAAGEARGVLAPLAASVSVILAPSALGVAPEGLAFTGDPVMCRPWTLLGVPAANVPGIRSRAGLPVGVQVVGPAFDDLAFLEELASIEVVMEREEG
jgi:Asp-tRNA(Asn)/Glu-tRNA(Gln) amidotransferase A subunit family amidase